MAGARSSRFLREAWSEIITLGPHNRAHWPAARVAIAVTVPLALLVAFSQQEWTAFAAFGAMSAIHSRSVDFSKRLRDQTGVGLCMVGSVFLGTLIGILAPASFAAVVAMAALSGLGFVLARRFGWMPVPSLFMVFAAGTLSSYQHLWPVLLIGTLISLGSALFGIALGQVGRPIRKIAREGQPADVTSAPTVKALRPRDRQALTAYIVGPLAAGSLAASFGIGHSYWAAVSATVPLVGSTLAVNAARAFLRVAGTLVGIGIAAIVLTLEPAPWILVLLVAVFQTITELFIARNYGIAVTAITPMAMILVQLGAPQPLDQLLRDRVIETVLGVTVSLMVLIVTRYLFRRRVGQPVVNGSTSRDGCAASR